MTDTYKPTRLLFDCETNGLLKEVTTVHCIGIIDVDSGEQFAFGPDKIDEALEMLYQCDEIIGHNIKDFDIRALWKVKRWSPRPGCRISDTLVISRLIHADLKREDAKRTDYPSKLIGSHGLKAWGIRLGEPKDEYGLDEHGKPIPGCWDEFNEEMFLYMQQDCRTNLRLLKYLKPWEYPSVPLALEHRVQDLTLLITEAGWPFDTKRAQALYQTLVQRRDALEKHLVDTFGSWQEVASILIPKRNNKTRGYTAGVPVTKYKTVTFNPGSRPHIEKKLKDFGWEPLLLTPSGRAQVDESELSKIDTNAIPEAKELIEYLLVQKRLGQIGDGDNGWLRVVDDKGLIHGRYNPMGTNTGRAAHYSPNLGQVPKVSAPYGSECRACFTVPKGWGLVGADLSGAQLRCLAHMVAHYDGGKYAEVVLNGDIHWYHAKAILGLPDDLLFDKHNSQHVDWRDKSKTTIYAFLFGAQAKKLGKVWGRDVAYGKQVMHRLEVRVHGLGKIRTKIKQALAGRSSLKGLDGRLIPIRSPHSALNAVIQNYEAVLCKTWICDAYDEMLASGFEWGWSGDFVFVGWIHDELQVAVRDVDDNIERAKKIITNAASNSGTPYNFKVRLDSEAKVGVNWEETH